MSTNDSLGFSRGAYGHDMVTERLGPVCGRLVRHLSCFKRFGLPKA